MLYNFKDFKIKIANATFNHEERTFFLLFFKKVNNLSLIKFIIITELQLLDL